MSHEIRSTADLSALSGQFNNATEVPIYYGADKTKTGSYKGIFNLQENALAQVASKNYQIIQHNDVVQALSNSLKSKNIEVFGRADDFGNQVRFDLIFGNKGTPIKDDSQGIMLGIRVLNSFNKSTSFRMEMFGFRMVCCNGMSLGKAMNEVKEVCFHVGEEKTMAFIEDLTEKFINNVITSSDKLQKFVSDSMKDSADWLTIPSILEKYLKHKKHRNKICELLDIAVIEVFDKKTKKRSFQYINDGESENISRWQFYNAITDYATHNELGLGVENQLQEVAQKILKEQYENLVEIEVPQR